MSLGRVVIEVAWVFAFMRSDLRVGCLFLARWLGRAGLAASELSSMSSGFVVGLGFFGGRPLTGIWASLVSALTTAGLAFAQWWSWIFSTPDLKVPTLTWMVE